MHRVIVDSEHPIAPEKTKRPTHNKNRGKTTVHTLIRSIAFSDMNKDKKYIHARGKHAIP
jgi:hypothetical protein